MNKINVSYWGHSVELLKILARSELFTLINVIIQSHHVNDEYIEFCIQNGIAVYEVNSKIALFEHCGNCPENIIVYCFGIIIPKPLWFSKTIINIHPGSLKTNRGAHSVLWSILLPNLGAGLSAYKICCDEVDSGELIASYSVETSDDETPMGLLRRMEDYGMDEVLCKIYEYICGANRMTTMVCGGIYRQRVQPEDYTIDLEFDSISTIKRKINSQKMYHGAILILDDIEHRIIDYKSVGNKFHLVSDDGVQIEV